MSQLLNLSLFLAMRYLLWLLVYLEYSFPTYDNELWFGQASHGAKDKTKPSSMTCQIHGFHQTYSYSNYTSPPPSPPPFHFSFFSTQVPKFWTAPIVYGQRAHLFLAIVSPLLGPPTMFPITLVHITAPQYMHTKRVKHGKK